MRVIKLISVIGLVLLPAVLQAEEPRGQPLWLPLGAAHRIGNPTTSLLYDPQKKNPEYDKIETEVYQEADYPEVQKTVLTVVRKPRWFRSGSYPKTLADVPQSGQAASLHLKIQASNEWLRVVLVLKAEKRPVYREVEHRWTNITPFLFAFFADGRPVPVKSLEMDSVKLGGVNSMIKLVDQGQTCEWDLTVDPQSIIDLVPGGKFKELSVVAAFGEYQHGGCAIDTIPDPANGFEGPPVFVRSNTVRIRYEQKKLTVPPED